MPGEPRVARCRHAALRGFVRCAPRHRPQSMNLRGSHRCGAPAFFETRCISVRPDGYVGLASAEQSTAVLGAYLSARRISPGRQSTT